MNGKRARTGMFINAGDEIRLKIALDKNQHRSFTLDLEVLYEDEDIALINKPAGLLTSGNAHKTLSNALLHNLKPSTREDAIAAQPAHRLDFATSGILVAGKTRSALETLNKDFEYQRIKKVYYAICIGSISSDYGYIDQAIDDKQAKTYYKRIAQVDSERFGKLSLLQLLPITGRKHQLRKHLLGIGHPILGDPLYFNPKHRLKGQGLYLHAYSLKLIHPQSKQTLSFHAPIPRKYKRIFDLPLNKDFLMR